MRLPFLSRKDDGAPRYKPVTTPTVLQMEGVECGAASLAIILAHFGRWTPLEELRVACGVSRDGSKASNIVSAARSYGLDALGFKGEPAVLRHLEPPLILHWNFNHFLVLNGFKKGRVLLNDPASGPRTVDEVELDEAFTGVVMTFKPGEDFEPGGDPPNLLPALGRRLRGARTGLLFVILAGLGLVLPGLVTPVYSKIFVDQLLLRGHLEWLGPLLAAMLVTAGLIGALTWLQQTYLLRLETKIALAGSSRFLWHVLKLPVEFFNQRFAGDISQRVGINNRVAQLLSRELATNVLGTMTSAFFLVLMIQFDLVLTLIGVAVVSLNVAALRWVSRRRTDASRRLLQEQGKVSGTALGGLQMIETLKAMGGEGDLFARWAGYQTKVANIRQDLEQQTQLLSAVPPLLATVGTAAILGVGSLRVIHGQLTLGELIAFQVLVAGFVGPIARLVNLGGQLQTVEGDMARLDDVLRYPVEPALDRQEAPDGDDPIKLAGRLELRGVSFGYSPLDPPLISDFDLVLEPGKRVALVGGSGSGKSTIAKLVIGLYQPWLGEILFDGQPRETISRAVLNGSLASVDQTISLFDGTVRDNLTLWDATVPSAEVVTAARDAAMHDVIAARVGGYESPVTEGGSNFSGGQRQRLEIARALVGRPSILVLDEATSALDPETEKEIDRHLRRRGCACLIVAHRLSTIRDADEIILLDRGSVVERGTHEALFAAGGPYAELIADES